MTDLPPAAATAPTRVEARGRPSAGALLAEQMSEAGEKRAKRRDHMGEGAQLAAVRQAFATVGQGLLLLDRRQSGLARP